LTVGIVTLPFTFEGKFRLEQAQVGINKLRKQVDSLIVINNNKLREVYGNLGFKAGFSKADEVLATASRGIAEVITHHYTQNIDLKDAKTVLANSGTAIMGSAIASGLNRAKEGIISALDSPLLNDNKITGAKNVLLLIVSGSDEITIDEIGEINEYIQNEAGHSANIIMGVGEDESLGETISLTIIATGFDIEQQREIVNVEPTKIIHVLDDEQKNEYNLTKTISNTFATEIENITVKPEERIVFELLDTEQHQEKFSLSPLIPRDEDLLSISEFIRNLDVIFEIVSPHRDLDFNSATAKLKNSEDIVTRPVQKVVTPPVFKLDSATRNIDVNEHTELVPITELTDTGIIRYTLEEYSEAQDKSIDFKTAFSTKEVLSEELNSTLKSVETVESDTATDQGTSPVDMTIEESLKLKSDERRKKMKDFNYKFSSNIARMSEFENVPAYKRQNIELTKVQTLESNSRTSLGTDSNNIIQLRSNNSYLHDTVD
jgi:cell division protein FtsZ